MTSRLQHAALKGNKKSSEKYRWYCCICAEECVHDSRQEFDYDGDLLPQIAAAVLAVPAPMPPASLSAASTAVRTTSS
jgi:hypothetical protein